MNITISGDNLNLGDHLNFYTKKKIAEIIAKNNLNINLKIHGMKDDFMDLIKKDKRFFRGADMKTSISVVKGLVEKYPNDQQLGSAVRHFILELQSHRRKREKNND